ncbi:hypothetical protein BH10BAC1_BH10BAC1_04650 [soil metagenome]
MNTIKAKILGLVLTSSLSFLSATAQQDRPVGDFTGIKAGDAFNINITQSDANSVKVDAPESVQAQIKTEVKDGILIISTEGNIKGDKNITISISAKSLSSIDISGASDVKSENQLICDKLSITTNGAGDVHLDIKATDIKADVSGAGDLTLKGSTQTLDATVSGAGDLKASNLEAAKITAKVSGAGDAKINVSQSLTADVSGAGSIIYRGNPAERNVNISGAGSVRESKSGNGEETASSDTTKIKLGGKNYMIIGENDDDDHKGKVSQKDSLRNYNDNFQHWQGIEFGVNGLMDYKNNINLTGNASFLELNYAKSLQFGLNLMEKDFHIYKNYVNIVTGLGFDFNHYSFQNNITLNGDTTYLTAFNDSVDYKKNKLNVAYLKVPLMLEFNTSKNPNKNLHIGVGAEFAYRINAVTKQKYEVNNKNYKIKNHDDYNLEPFKYSAVARIGYNDVTVYASYGLNRLFKKDKGPQVYPFTLGVTFSI